MIMLLLQQFSVQGTVPVIYNYVELLLTVDQTLLPNEILLQICIYCYLCVVLQCTVPHNIQLYNTIDMNLYS